MSGFWRNNFRDVMIANYWLKLLKQSIVSCFLNDSDGRPLTVDRAALWLSFARILLPDFVIDRL